MDSMCMEGMCMLPCGLLCWSIEAQQVLWLWFPLQVGFTGCSCQPCTQIVFLIQSYVPPRLVANQNQKSKSILPLTLHRKMVRRDKFIFLQEYICKCNRKILLFMPIGATLCKHPVGKSYLPKKKKINIQNCPFSWP